MNLVEIYNNRLLMPGDIIEIIDAGQGARGANNCIAKILDPLTPVYADGVYAYKEHYLVLIIKNLNHNKTTSAVKGGAWRINKKCTFKRLISKGLKPIDWTEAATTV